MQPWMVACGAAFVGLAAVVISGAYAGLVPGGGPGKSDCYAELDIQGISNPADVVSNKKVSCTDGDECDKGPCGDAVCTFGVAVCWNQNDPTLPECSPPASLERLKLKGAASVINLSTTFEGSSCTGGFVNIVVGTKKNGTKPGSVKAKLLGKAPKGTKPRTDKDNIKLTCLPRTSACPSTTTSTTGVPTTSTTHGPTTTTAAPTTTVAPTTTTTTTAAPTTSTSTTTSTTTTSSTTTSSTTTSSTTTSSTTTTTDTTTSSTTTTDTTTSSTTTTEEPTTTTDTTTSSTTTTEEPTTTTDTTTSSTTTTEEPTTTTDTTTSTTTTTDTTSTTT